MPYPKTFRKLIELNIKAVAEERKMTLTEEELKSATDGVEYYINEVMPDSIDVALSNIQYDREILK